MKYGGIVLTEIESCLEHIEWEGLQKPWEIDQIDLSKNLFQGSKKIEIWRDESYKIKAKIMGNPKDDDKEKIDGDRKPGKMIPTFNIKGTLYNGFIKYELDGCVLSGITYNTHNGETVFEAPLLTHEIKKIFPNDNKTAWLTEWYLNGSDEIAYFPRTTERNSFLNFERLRNSIDKDLKKFKGGHSGNISRDFAFINDGKLQFLITQVPKGLGPAWSNSLGIEYRNEFGGIPDKNIREAISEIVSFFIGRQLLNIGFSTFTNKGDPIVHVSFSPWGSNVVHLCQLPGYPPCRYKRSGLKSYEETLSKATYSYLILRDELQLNDVMWRYWIAKNNPIGTNLPIFSSAIETLSNSWLKSKKSKTKGVYLQKKDFDKLLEKEFSQIEKIVKSIKYGDRIFNRMKNTFQMGANERLLFFFDEISLSIGKIEKEVLKSRNKMVHGHSIKTDEEKNEMITMTEAYATLIHRALLKILDYEGSYIDRSSIGFPERKIDETLLGLK